VDVSTSYSTIARAVVEGTPGAPMLEVLRARNLSEVVDA
jgi:hypothetical protein